MEGSVVVAGHRCAYCRGRKNLHNSPQGLHRNAPIMEPLAFLSPDITLLTQALVYCMSVLLKSERCRRFESSWGSFKGSYACCCYGLQDLRVSGLRA